LSHPEIQCVKREGRVRRERTRGRGVWRGERERVEGDGERRGYKPQKWGHN
jgi:hypothetical protein